MPSRFTKKALKDFKRKDSATSVEDEVLGKVFSMKKVNPVIAGSDNLASQRNLQFGNLADLINGSIPKAQPGFTTEAVKRSSMHRSGKN